MKHAIAKEVEIRFAKEMSRGKQHSIAQVAQKQRGFDIMWRVFTMRVYNHSGKYNRDVFKCKFILEVWQSHVLLQRILFLDAYLRSEANATREQQSPLRSSAPLAAAVLVGI